MYSPSRASAEHCTLSRIRGTQTGKNFRCRGKVISEPYLFVPHRNIHFPDAPFPSDADLSRWDSFQIII